MPTTTQPCRLSLTTQPGSDVVVRALVLLRRRGCNVVGVSFRRADRHGPGSFELSVEAPARVRHCLEGWLLGLVDVVAVEDADLCSRMALEPSDDAVDVLVRSS